MFILSLNVSKNLLVSIGEIEKCYDAFNYGRREEALTLLKQVKNPHIVKSKSNFNILHCAAYHGWLDVVKQLINDHQFDPDCKDDDGNTPSSKARGNGKQSVVDYLETVIGTFVVLSWYIINVVQSAEYCTCHYITQVADVWNMFV